MCQTFKVKLNQIIILFLILPFCAFNQHRQYADLCFIDDSEINILGSSNVTDYQCILHDLTNNSNIEIKSQVFDRTIKLQNAKVVLLANGFDCENRIMTKDFLKAIKGEKYPEITVAFHQFTLSDNVNKQPNQKNIPAKISIYLAGVTNYYSILLDRFEVKSDELQVVGLIHLRMSDFNITPPTALFGTIKTEDEITIDFKINFKFK